MDGCLLRILCFTINIETAKLKEILGKFVKFVEIVHVQFHGIDTINHC